ncbi:MAG: capsid cement protein, partial [Verrucomicrobiota bacterium]
MAKNYVQPGKVLTLTAPYDRLAAGLGAQVGSLFGVALGIVLSGAAGEFATEGVWTLAKTSAQAWTVGQKIYWDNSNKRCDSDSTVGQLIGVATAVAANPSSTGDVRLNESVPSTLEGPQAAEANLTDNSGGAAADGTIGAVTTFTPSLAWNGVDVHPSAADATAIAAAITALMAAVKELSTKQNALLAKLR